MENSKLYRAGVSDRFIDASFDNYAVIDDEQRANKASCIEFAESVKNEGSSNLLMLGKVGAGKTHLACSILRALENPQYSKIIKLSEIITGIREARFGKAEFTESEIIHRLSTKELLIIDEIGIQKNTDDEKIVLFDIIDNRYKYMLPTVIISNLNIEQLKDVLGERAIDRLREGGKLLAFNSESKRGANA